MGLVPDYCNKANIGIKQVNEFFGFPVHIKVVFEKKLYLYCSLLSMQ